MVREGIPFLLGTALPAAAFAVLFFLFGGIAFLALAGVFAALALFMAYFFRDPERVAPVGDDIIVSAADGRVTRVEHREDGAFVSVFLSPFDVHVNRAPISGAVTQVDYIKGRKSPATSDQASLVNERNSLTIENGKITVVCTQIAGIVARRIVCHVQKGDNLRLGERFGLIKFSSRTDLLMPVSAEILVGVGDRVVGGETIIARLK
jgi:phosphatidylserine decarboxylase